MRQSRLSKKSTNNHLLLDPEMGTKDQMTREDTGLKTIFELESISGKPILEIKKAILDEKLQDSHVLMHEDRDGDHLKTEQYHLNLLNDKIDINETSRFLYLISKSWK